ncbi:MAG: hypothetical protein ACRC31_04580, partial [Cetobacterium sp.]
MADISLDLEFQGAGLSDLLKSIKELNKSLEGSELAGKKGSKGVIEVDKSAKTTEKSVGKLDESLKKFMANPIVATAAAVTALSIAIKKSTEAINVQIKAEQGLSFAVSNNTNLTKDSTKSLMEYASELQSITTFGDEYTMSLMQMGAQANATEEDIKNMTKLALDISAQSGQDAKSVMQGLTLAYQDVDKATRVLTQSGIALTESEKQKIQTLKESGKEAEAIAVVMDKLNSKFGGAADKDAQSFAGTMTQIYNIMGDVSEEFGRIVMAFSKPFANSFKDSMESLYNFITDPKIVDGIQSYIAYLQTGFDV